MTPENMADLEQLVNSICESLKRQEFVDWLENWGKGELI
jgi:hypothetical protein